MKFPDAERRGIHPFSACPAKAVRAAGLNLQSTVASAHFQISKPTISTQQLSTNKNINAKEKVKRQKEKVLLKG